MLASQFSGPCDVNSNRLWRHQQSVKRASETRGRWLKIVDDGWRSSIIEINNKHVYRQSQVREPTGSGDEWAECSLIIWVGYLVQVVSGHSACPSACVSVFMRFQWILNEFIYIYIRWILDIKTALLVAIAPVLHIRSHYTGCWSPPGDHQLWY